MKTIADLRKLLLSIDHRSYPAYKDTRGQWSCGNYILSIDHVQGDPFASPSNVSVIVPGRIALFPGDYMTPKYRLVTLEDMLLRFFSRQLRDRDRQRSGGPRSDSFCRGKEQSSGDFRRSDEQSSGDFRRGDEQRGGDFRRDGSGKSGLIAVSRPGQEVLERTACRVDPVSGDVTLRF